MTQYNEQFTSPNDPGAIWVRMASTPLIPDPEPPEPLSLRITLYASAANIQHWQSVDSLLPFYVPPFENH